MSKHQTRLFFIFICTLTLLIGQIVLMVKGMFGTTESAVLGGSLLVLLPALADAGVVERRRRTPGEKAIEDDDG